MGSVFTTQAKTIDLASVLAFHIDAGTLTRKGLHAAADNRHDPVSYSTICRFVNGELQPTLPQFLRMLGHLPNAVTDDLLFLIAHSARRSIAFEAEIADEHLDANGDGRITTEDLVSLVACELGDAQQDSTDKTIRAAADRLIEPEEGVPVVNLMNRIKRMASRAKAIVAKIGLRPC